MHLGAPDAGRTGCFPARPVVRTGHGMRDTGALAGRAGPAAAPSTLLSAARPIARPRPVRPAAPRAEPHSGPRSRRGAAPSDGSRCYTGHRMPKCG